MEDSGGREGGVPESDGHETRIAARSSLIDSIKGCGISGMRIDKDELRADILMPEYLRKAMAEAIKNKAVSDDLEERFSHDGITASPKAPIVVFINSRSGGRHGPELKTRLEELMAEEQVFDLSIVRPREFFQYGLACLEKIAHSGDTCARQTREKLRVLVAGGDGTVGWVLGCTAELYSQNRTPVPPTGIIPLGTGNDLSRSFGWGGSFPYIWKSAVKRSLTKVANGPTCNLDSWQVVVTMPSEEIVKFPENMRKRETCNFDQDEEVGEDCPKNPAQAEGTFYNYFSIGMDAQVAYGFHHLRDEKPYLAKGPIANKLIYSGYGCTQGWFCTPCINDPGLRGLNNVLELHVKRLNYDKWEQIEIPPSVRAIVALNLHNYGSGRHPWGDLKPEYLEKREFVEAHADDGLLEIFGLKQGWHATMVMVELIKAKHLAQATAIKLKLRGDLIKQTFLQMDGEPWKQPLRDDSSTFVEIRREHYQSLMIRGD